MRLFLSRYVPPFQRIVLVESGSRHVLEGFLRWLKDNCPDLEHIDLVTCYPGAPIGFAPERGRIHRVYEYQGRDRRKQLYAKLEERHPHICVVICSGEPIMTKWKWAIGWKTSAKVLVLNENGDFFFFDRSQIRNIWHLALFRAGLTGGNAASSLGHLALFPFTLAYLLLFAGWIHLRRKVRT